MYDHTLGRFLARDPVGYSTGDTNLYRYTSGNPTNALDPLGERTYVEQTGTSAKDCKIKVTSVIDFKGEAATEQNVEKIVKEIKKYWNAGFKYKCCAVEFEIDYKIHKEVKAKPGELVIPERSRPDADTIVLLEGSDKYSWQDQVSKKPYDQNHTGIWAAKTKQNPDNLTWTPAHEYGHLLGLPDRYDRENMKPHEGWEKNIMAAEFEPEDPRAKGKVRTKVEQKNINEFLDQAKDKKTNEPLKDFCC